MGRVADQDAFLARLGLALAESSRLDLAHLRLRVVPTVVLVDRGGHALFVHEGVIGLAEQARVLEAIENQTRTMGAGSRGGV